MPTPTTFRRRSAEAVGGNGSSPTGLSTPQLASVARRRSTAAIVLALLCVAGGALAGVIAYKAGSARQSVLAASHALAGGHVLQAGDLRVVDLSTDGGLSFILAADENSLLGRPVGVPVAAGAPLTSGELGSTPAAGPGQAVIGVLCKAGQYPPSLAPGDTVELVDSSGTVGTATSTSPTARPIALPLAAITATVIGVDSPTDTATVGTVISLRLSADDAPSVARAAAAGAISLILIAPGS
jgi:Flp pilus assembly protein CpaB